MPSGWTFTAQYYCDCLFDEIEKSVGKRSFEHGATLNISKTLFSETLKLSASGLIMLIDFDSVLELIFSTKERKKELTDNMKI